MRLEPTDGGASRRHYFDGTSVAAAAARAHARGRKRQRDAEAAESMRDCLVATAIIQARAAQAVPSDVDGLSRFAALRARVVARQGAPAAASDATAA